MERRPVASRVLTLASCNAVFATWEMWPLCLLPGPAVVFRVWEPQPKRPNDQRRRPPAGGRRAAVAGAAASAVRVAGAVLHESRAARSAKSAPDSAAAGVSGPFLSCLRLERLDPYKHVNSQNDQTIHDVAFVGAPGASAPELGRLQCGAGRWTRG